METFGSIWRKHKPDICRKQNCTVKFQVSDTSLIFFHNKETMSLPATVLDDVQYNIWGKVRPWLETRHDAASGRDTRSSASVSDDSDGGTPVQS